MRHRVPPLLLLTVLACAGERSEVGDAATTTTGPELGCFGCACAPDLPCADGLECTHEVCSLIDETGGDEAPPSACGWNPAASWYDCGFQGADPNGDFSRACPADLEPETACPASLPFEGCCDEDGNVWYCDEGMVVATPC